MNKFAKYYGLPEIQRVRDLINEQYASKILFIEDSHEYFIDGEQYTSVSEVTHRYKPVTSEQMAENCVARWQSEQDETYKYYGMTKEEILAKWKRKSDAACEFGTNVHAFGESMFYFMTGQPEKILPECESKFTKTGPKPTNTHEEAVVKFWNDLPENYVPVLAETRVFNRNGVKYCGTFDLLLYYINEMDHSRNGLIIEDYKTNEELYKNIKNQKLLWPFNDLLDQNASYYTLQLSAYQIPLENLGLKTVARRLIWLKPDGTYDHIKIPSLTDRMREALRIPSANEIITNKIL